MTCHTAEPSPAPQKSAASSAINQLPKVFRATTLPLTCSDLMRSRLLYAGRL